MEDPYAGGYGGGEADAAVAAVMGMMGAFWLIALALLVFSIFLQWKIFSKAGYSGALSLLFLVPLGGFILTIWFAFADWPVLKKARGEQVP